MQSGARSASPNTIFAFLLNSSGAIIIFVYIRIAVSQIVLRFRNSGEQRKVKMRLFPGLSILTTLAMLAILVQMFFNDELRFQLVLSLLSWAVVILLFLASRWFVNRRPIVEELPPASPPHRALLCLLQSVGERQLVDSLWEINPDRDCTYFVVVPESAIGTGAAATHGPLDVAEATATVAQSWLDDTLAQPEYSVWDRVEIVDRAREAIDTPITHLVASPKDAGAHA